MMIASVWIDYCVNNDYIKEVLCINKERPKLQCDGKCYLAKQLKKQSEQKESKEKGVVIEQSITPVFFVVIQDFVFRKKESLSTDKNHYYFNHYQLLFDSEKDRPPIISSELSKYLAYC
nr:hypothetical protein [uncultured Allomuricauda sp.]